MNFTLFGQPIAHSLSPKIHQLIWEYLGIEGNSYSLTEQNSVPTREQLQIVYGANITIPLKEQVVVDKISDAATTIGAINTIYWQDDILYGDNTDWLGVDMLIADESDLSQVLIVGTGGAAKAVRYALQQRGVGDNEITYGFHQKKMAATMSMQVQLDVLDIHSFTTIFQTTPVDCVDDSQLDDSVWYYDLRYNRDFTRVRSQNGLVMLIAQAIASEALWLQKPLFHDKQLFIYIKEQLLC